MQEGEVCVTMNVQYMEYDTMTEWFALKTRHDFRAERELSPVCEELLFPKEVVKIPGRRDRVRAFIPHVLFVRTSRDVLLHLEQKGREEPELSVPFWIYRYPKDRVIQVIPPSSIHLLRLLTSGDTDKCEVFNKTELCENRRVRVTGGAFQGYEGYVVRVRKNRHVVVKIEGICLVMLPFIHPDLLDPIE